MNQVCVPQTIAPHTHTQYYAYKNLPDVYSDKNYNAYEYEYLIFNQESLINVD